jgi:hypothetical protein
VPERTRTSQYVLFVPCGGFGNASARTRVHAYLPFLGKFGLRFHIASYTYHRYDHSGSRGFWGKLWLELLPVRNVIAFLKADTLFFQKKSITPWMVNWGKRLGKRVVYDLDDALYLLPPRSDAGGQHKIESDKGFLPRLEWILSKADLVLVSGDELARFALQFARKVRILPSVVSSPAMQVDRPLPPRKRGGDKRSGLPSGTTINNHAVIGWVGAPENQTYLREIEGALVRLQSEMPDLDIRIVTSEPMQPLPKFKARFIPWSLEAEQREIPQFTVGIAPLTDDPWCRAKMNFKALVYMSYGVPAVVSPVGFPEQEFEDGKNVLLAKTEEDWYRCLKLLLTDTVKHDDVAAGGLNVVQARFSAEARAGEFASAMIE